MGGKWGKQTFPGIARLRRGLGERDPALDMKREKSTAAYECGKGESTKGSSR